ncbi:F-box protein [Sporobolomyces salmoneus]|uniref:F-box protein n=1 Tax=Sporobolomyces salmoneus TaxID=183962 RepID=UPI00316E04CC
MSPTALPDELIEDIFTRDLEQADLASLCRTSKLFSAIAKPLLYRTITIRSHHQAEQFYRNTSQEDFESVKRLEIVGKGNPWAKSIRYMETLSWRFECPEDGEEGVQVTEMGTGCVKEFIEGFVVDLDRINSIFVRNVVENPNVLWRQGYGSAPVTFANLTDLSFVSYRGGCKVIAPLLQRRYLPALERLVLCHVTYADPPSHPFTGFTGRTSYNFIEADEYRISTRRLEDHSFELFNKLKLLVAPSLDITDKHQPLVHLIVFDYRSELRRTDKFVIVDLSDAWNETEYADFFAGLSEGLQTIDLSTYSLEYLAVPPSLKLEFLDSSNPLLPYLESHGVAVYFDAELG